MKVFMKLLAKVSLIFALAFAVIVPTTNIQAQAAAITTTATGYTKASNVDYVRDGNYVANWGSRDETCVFLSTYAENFYTGSYVYDTMSKNAGGSSQSNAPTSALYSSLKSLMESKQTYTTSYDATKDLFCYTDCVNSVYSKISSFYSGETISGTWDGGTTWNREHTWPNSKGDRAGNGENDIMMLRPASVSENSSRGNKAYGENSSSTYYDPNQEGQSLRGDCARIVLFQYVRWGCTNTGSKYNPTDIFGAKGVIESLNVLLKWMEQDPVDTWEMGRNDAVQSITGTRNVFVDYPEYAWLLFGRSIPTNMTTPSGIAKSGMGDVNVPDPTPTPDGGNTGNGSNNAGGGNTQTPVVPGCVHEYGDWFVTKPSTTEEEGSQTRFCQKCGEEQTGVIPKKTDSGNGKTVAIVVGASVGGVGLITAAIFIFRRKAV